MLLWQHLFWFFGHPEVYIIFIPALGMLSNMIIVFSRRKIVGHSALCLRLSRLLLSAFGLWVHHMFADRSAATGLELLHGSQHDHLYPDRCSDLLLDRDSGTGRLRWDTPLYYVFGFFAVFIIGGMTGVMTASVPLDWQIHDTFFIVAHLHYVLIGGSVFPLLGSIHYWWPNMTGRMLSESLGKVALLVRVRRIQSDVLSHAHPWASWDAATRVYVPAGDRLGSRLNLLATLGAVILGDRAPDLPGEHHREPHERLSMRSTTHGTRIRWSGLSESPAPAYNFMHIPVVESRYPLWDRSDPMPVVSGLSHTCRESLVTSVRTPNLNIAWTTQRLRSGRF